MSDLSLFYAIFLIKTKENSFQVFYVENILKVLIYLLFSTAVSGVINEGLEFIDNRRTFWSQIQTK